MDTPITNSEGHPLTDLLANFAVSTDRSQVPAAAVDNAKRLILDTLGCALAASAVHMGKIVKDYAAAHGGAPADATIIGSGGKKVGAATAALANGTLANALDFDEGSHISTHVLPAVLATAEHYKLSGKEALDGFIFGWECGARLTHVIDYRRKELKGPTFKGWWHVGLIGPIAAATGVARMLKLDRKQAASAIGVATCAGSGFRRNMGMMAKALHSGIAARQGVEAVELAKMGFTGDTEIIEAPLGFLAAVCPPEDRDIRPVSERLGKPYVLAGPQRIKIYPMCNPAHPIIDAALRLHAQKSFTIDDIEGIDADLHTFSLLRAEPWDEETAGFSGAYAIAASLVHGKLTLDQMTEKSVHDPRVKALMKKISHVPQKKDEKVTVKLKGGKTAVVDVHEVKRLTTQEQVSAKFRDCAARVLPAASLDGIEEAVAKLEDQPNLDRLVKLVGG